MPVSFGPDRSDDKVANKRGSTRPDVNVFDHGIDGARVSGTTDEWTR